MGFHTIGAKLLKLEDLKLHQKGLKPWKVLICMYYRENIDPRFIGLHALKQLHRLDARNPDSHRCLIRFFHKIASRLAPVTGGEKLISGLHEAERPTISQLHDKSRMEANIVFLEQHKGDNSLNLPLML
uniref:Uncharacterized protein n=1 Tax=Lactuca sativa TaxID=4236 RepID=A0A9R1VFZ5_LACSA|nr:hypothetical protein LSAT_V11C500238430 [Lactuca sativa]